MKRALVFYTYLPTWRIDIFNYLSSIYKTKICFTIEHDKAFVFNKARLVEEILTDVIFLNNGFELWGYTFRSGIWRLLRQEKPELIFTHEYCPTSLYLSILVGLNLLRSKLIVTTSDNVDSFQNAGIIKKMVRYFILSQSSGMVVYSEKVKLCYEKIYNLNIEVCPNIQDPERLLKISIDSDRYFTKLREKHAIPENFIIFVGRLEFVKGVDLLLKNLNVLVNENFKLVLVGKGSEKAMLTELAIKFKIANNLIWIDELIGNDLYSLYKRAKFLVLPSRYEPFGAVVNEALVFGCPVLLSEKAGATDYIRNGYNGEIINVFDSSEFTRCLEKWWKRDVDFKDRQNLMVVDFKRVVRAFEKVGLCNEYE